MKELPVHNIDSESLYEEIILSIKRRGNPSNAIRAAQDQPYTKKSSLFDSYKAYIAIAPNFEILLPSKEISAEYKEMLAYVYDNDAIFHNEKLKIHSLYGDGKCPFCMLSEATTLDHYLSKSVYPEFTLLPQNLVPCCYTCNNYKSSLFLDQNNKRQFLHYYYDRIPEKPIIRFHYEIRDGLIMTKYDVDESIEGEEYDIFRKQFRLLHIDLRLKRYTTKFVSRTFGELSETYSKGRKHLIMEVEDKLKSSERVYGVNHYTSVFYRSIHADINKFVAFRNQANV